MQREHLQAILLDPHIEGIDLIIAVDQIGRLLRIGFAEFVDGLVNQFLNHAAHCKDGSMQRFQITCQMYRHSTFNVEPRRQQFQPSIRESALSTRSYYTPRGRK